MTIKQTSEMKRLFALIQRLPIKDDEKQKWMGMIETNGLSEELLLEIRETVSALPDDAFASQLLHLQTSTELSRITQQWRMSTSRKNFRHSR